MAKFGKYFTYNGRSMESLGTKLRIVSFNNADEIDTGLERELIKGEVTKYRYRANHLGAKYSDVISFTINVMKDPCIYPQNELAFSTNEIRNVTSWLTSPATPRLFHMYDNSNAMAHDELLDYYGVFTNIDYHVINGKVYGLILTMTCDSPFAYTQEIVKELPANSTTTIKNNSDELESYIYPYIEIYPTANTDFTFQNVTDKKSITFTGLLKNNTVYMDCQSLILKQLAGNVSGVSGASQIGFTDLGVTDVGKIYWPRLVSGNNSIKITGSATVTLKYRELRKVGAY